MRLIIMNKIRENFYCFLSLFFFVLVFIFCVYFLHYIFVRSIQVFSELGVSLAFYFQELSFLDLGIIPNVNQSNYFNNFSLDFLPDNFENFKNQIIVYFYQLFNKEFFFIFLNDFSSFLRLILIIILLFIPMILIFFLFSYRYFKNQEKRVGKVSKFLRFVDRINDVYKKIKFNFLDFINWFVNNKYTRFLFMFFVLYFTNLFNVFIAFISYYLYLCVSLDFISLYIQFKRFFIDISFLFKDYLIIFWLILFGFVSYFIFKDIAERRISYYFVRDVHFIDSLGLLTFITGVMAKGKTTLLTDFAITQEVIFKNKAKDELVKFSLYFPNIDFSLYENMLDDAFENHLIFSLSSCKDWIKDHVKAEYLHDFKYFNGVTVITLFDVLYNYALLYWVYVSPTSFINSNYAIRSSLLVFSREHFMEWSDDLLNPTPDLFSFSIYSHVLDFNNFRSKKKINNRLDYSLSNDIGVFVFDEVGKERLNQVEMEDIKKSSIVANQKNDGFNLSLKMARHRATINNYPFIKFFMAEQRMQSLNADARELNDIVLEIQKDSKEKNVFPFWFFISFFLDILESFLKKIYLKYRHNRDDLNLFFQILKNSLSFILKTKEKIMNRYGVKILKIKLYDGNQNFIKDDKYYLIYRKIYSSRFSTDAFSDYYYQKGRESKIGLNDLPSYSMHRATLDELKLQNSYFINYLLFEKDGDLKREKTDSRFWRKKEE